MMIYSKEQLLENFFAKNDVEGPLLVEVDGIEFCVQKVALYGVYNMSTNKKQGNNKGSVFV